MMRPVALGATRVDEALRVVRALGAHRYVAGRLHLVHALALAAPREVPSVLAGARAWALDVLGDDAIDAGSRDEVLWRRCTDTELGAVLESYWAPGEVSGASRRALESLLARHGLAPGDGEPFDEAAEDGMHPLLTDAGWELVPLSELDAERHRGARTAFGDALSFESACFEEQTAIPVAAHLYELPAVGPIELLRGAREDGSLAAPLVVWAEGNETYLDYVIRGVRRAAGLPEYGG
jgi:hypothetical protein